MNYCSCRIFHVNNIEIVLIIIIIIISVVYFILKKIFKCLKKNNVKITFYCVLKIKEIQSVSKLGTFKSKTITQYLHLISSSEGIITSN